MRIGSILILISEPSVAVEVNEILSRHHALVLGRQGIPLRDKGINVISLVIEGELADINSLSGQLGKLDNVQVKTILAKEKERG